MPREPFDAESGPGAGSMDPAAGAERRLDDGTVAGAMPAESLDSLLREKYEPIAIVGVGLRFPGGSESLEEFGDFLAEGRSGISPLPTDRWDVAAFTADNPDERGKIRTTGGGFLDRIDLFDPTFFNISPKEAQYMDPQQRMLLETAWQALEHAQIDPTPLRRGNGGVYVGASSIDYALELDSVPYPELDGLLASGITMFPLSGRLSYFLGWRGPSASIDTACSSSLTALHMAVQGLRRGECDIALCGGVNALHHPRIPVMFSHAQMLAPDGQCKTFDDAADGYVRAEGCGVVVLKRLSSAERDGNRILAVIRGTAVGQDGDSAGLTVPNGAAQETVIRQALRAARLDPADIQYVEAHGTGTPLGDPIELGAINDVFADSHDQDEPLLVGSVKTNLGHMEPASGLVGLIKVVAQLQQGEIFAHLNLRTPSGRIPWNIYPIEIPTSTRPWPAPIRRAVVNSFGFAGTIAAVVLEQPPATDQPSAEPVAGPAVLTLSAKSPVALAAQLDSYRQLAERTAETDLGRLCHSTNVGRAHFKHRVAAVIDDRAGLLRVLDGEIARTERTEPTGIRKVGFMFSGQGAQYAGMGAALYRRFPVFARWIDECDRLFEPLVQRSIRGLLLDSDDSSGLIDQTRFTQPALFSYEYALARLWMSWGIQPGVLIGHSIGEVTAAAVAGVFQLPDAVRLVAARGRLMQSVTTAGGMAAVSAPAEQVSQVLAEYPELALAAVNAPDQCVISGAGQPLAEASRHLQEAGMRVEQLSVSHAFHSPLMAEIYDEFRSEIADIAFDEPGLTIVSNVTGKVVRRSEMSDPDYWVRHIGSPVLFRQGLQAGVRRGRHALIEIGPSTALTALAGRCLDDAEHLWLASQRRRDPSERTILQALTTAYLGGLAVDWTGVHADRPQSALPLPSYPFQRKRYWLPVQTGSRVGAAGSGPSSHPLLGLPQPADPITPASWAFCSELSVDQPAHLAEHQHGGRPVVPISAYIEMMFAAQDAVWGHTGRVITELVLDEPLALTEAPVPVHTRLIGSTDADAAVSVVIESMTEAGPIRHARATLSTKPAPLTASDDLWKLIFTPGQAVESIPAEDLYVDLASVGRGHGQRFQVLTGLTRHPAGVLTGTLTCRPSTAVEQLPFDVLESALLALAGSDLDGVSRTPVRVAEVRIFKKPRAPELRLVAEVRPDPAAPDSRRIADLLLLEGKSPVAELRGAVLAAAGDRAERQNFRHELVWMADPEPAAAAGGRHVLVLNGARAGLPSEPSEPAGPRLTTLDRVEELAAALADPTVTDVCWCWRPGSEPVTVAGLQTECEQNFTEVLALMAALEASPPSRRLRLWLVTSGAQLLDGDRPDGGQALAASNLWGFGRVLQNEHPRYSCTLVDVEPATAAADLLEEWGQDRADEPQLAYRSGVRHVRRIVAVTPTAEPIPAGFALRADRTYLVTGGLGGLGLVTARKLVELGARQLVLVSRRCTPTPEASAVLRELSGRARIELIPADLGSAEDVRRLFETVAHDLPPLGGVVHAAGEIGKSMIAGLDWPAIDKQLRPKVYGGWLLHEATRLLPEVEFFLVYTSIAGIIGGVTQAHYAAASSYLDGLARWRQAAGLPGSATNWGAWAGVGMSARLDGALSKQVELGGIHFFSPSRALAALTEMLARPAAQRILGEYDWDVIAAAAPSRDQLYAEVAVPLDPIAAGLDITALLGKPQPERIADIDTVVRSTVAAALQFDDPASLDATAELVSLGLDSLMAMEVKRSLETNFGLSLAASLAYDYPSVSQLTSFVDGQLVGAVDG